jgi:hypothetical protein
MDLANMRRQGVRNLNEYCLNDACRHQAVIDVSSYPGDTKLGKLPPHQRFALPFPAGAPLLSAIAVNSASRTTRS